VNTKESKKRSAYEQLISFLQGASWALAVVGATSFFIFLHPFGVIVAIVGAFIGSLGGLFFVVIFGIAHQQSEKLEEMKKQTKLLEKLLDEKISNN
jgi:membrane associated rhomboid family serine protease